MENNNTDTTDNLNSLNDDNINQNENNNQDIQEFMNELRPLYPPLITPESLMPKLSNPPTRKISGKLNNKRKKESNIKFPNAFIAYRMEFCKQLKNKKVCLTMQDVSYFASKLWKKEPCNVKKTYTQLANDAKSLYEKRKEESLLAEKEQQKENENEILQQQQQQSNSTNMNDLDFSASPLSSLNSLSSSSSLNSSPIQVNSILKDTQQTFPTKDLQQNLVETTNTVSSPPQISSTDSTQQPLYIEQNLSSVNNHYPYNVLFNSFPPLSEEYIAQPPVFPQSYFSPDFFQYIHYSIPDLKHRLRCLESEKEFLNNVISYLQYETRYPIQYSGRYW